MIYTIIKHIAICLGLMIPVMSYGRTVIFVTPDDRPVADVRCTGYTAANDSVASWTSGTDGSIDVTTAGVSHIVAAHPGYSDRIVFMDRLGTQDRVVLSPGVDLKEVVVTPTDVEEFDTHTSYRLSRKDMARYPTVLQSLNVIPNLTVLSNGTVFFEGNSDIKILIDGVEASADELKTLSKDDVAKVDVYQTPPPRFQVQGVSAVLDIRLKSKLHGGNVGVDISQAFQALKGLNNAAMYYNYRQSRFTLRYNNQNRHYRRYRRSEVLDYDFGGVHYRKTKEGRDSRYNLDDNQVNLSYQVNKPGNFLYNVKAGVAFSRDGETALQDVTAAGNSFLATNKLQTNYTRYNVGNYFEKDFGERHGMLLGNVNYMHYSTYYNSAYNELYTGQGAVNDSRSQYDTNLDAVFSELQYQLPFRKLGMLTACVYGNYKHSRYVDTEAPFSQDAGLLGGQMQWMGRKGPIGWYLALGAQWLHTSSDRFEPYDRCVPQSSLNVNWRPSRNVSFILDYSYGGSVPSISQLSETEQWIDTRLVYHGNSALRPYRTHSAGLRFVWNTRYHSLSMRNRFESSPGRICDMYTETDRYMLQTLVNLSRYREWSTTVDLTIKPLGDSRLVFWNRVALADLNGKNKEYSWHGYRIQWMTTLTLNLEHWTAELYYQYPGKVAEGQLVRPRAQCWSATVLYRPMTDLSVGLEVFMPFGKGFTESERTVREAPVYSDTRLKIMDLNNLVSLKLSYNFGFGRNRNSAGPQFDNYDNDSGILRK